MKVQCMTCRFSESIQYFQDEIVVAHLDAGTKILADKGYISNVFGNILITPLKGSPYDLSPEEWPQSKTGERTSGCGKVFWKTEN